MFYGWNTVLDIESGLAVTRRTVGGVPVGPPKVQTLDAFIHEAIAPKLAENLNEQRQRELGQLEDAEGNPILEMEYEIPNLPPLAKTIIGEGPKHTAHLGLRQRSP